MNSSIEEKNVALINCHSCQYELRSHDRYCRRCGVAQTPCVTDATTRGLSTPLPRLSYDTSPLPTLNSNQRVSGKLVGLLAAALPQTAGTREAGIISRNLMHLLISFPIWLLLVLLSPLDAWTTARGITRQI